MSTQSSKRSRLESEDAILDESNFRFIAGNQILKTSPFDGKTSKISKEVGCINKLEQIFNYGSSDQHKKLITENKYFSKAIFLWNKLYNDAKTVQVENKINFLTNTELDINVNRLYLSKNNFPHLSNQFIDMDYTFFSDELQKSINKSINLEDMQVHISKINIFPMNYTNTSSSFSKRQKLSQSNQLNKSKTNAAINNENRIKTIIKDEKVSPEKENDIRQAFDDKLRKDLDSALKRNDELEKQMKQMREKNNTIIQIFFDALKK
ncbi:unnamed protein product, partial [Brachionus calyciflorus]